MDNVTDIRKVNKLEKKFDLKQIKAPMPETIKDAIFVLKSFIESQEKKLSQRTVGGPIAQLLIAKAIGIEKEMIEDIIHLSSQEMKMEIAAIKIAITALEEIEENK